MKQSTLDNHTNKVPEFNCTHVEAWAVAYTVRRWSIWNLLYWFKPPQLHSVSIIPERMDLVDKEDKFEPSMFKPNGTFYHTPLNHYIRLRINNGQDEFWANAAILLNEFIVSPRHGYRMLKEFISRAKEELAKTGPTEDRLGGLQEAGVSNRGRDTSVLGGVDNTGE